MLNTLIFHPVIQKNNPLLIFILIQFILYLLIKNNTNRYNNSNLYYFCYTFKTIFNLQRQTVSVQIKKITQQMSKHYQTCIEQYEQIILKN